MAGDDLLMQRHGRHAGLDDGLDLFQKGESVRSSARCAPDGYQILSAQSAAEGFALLALHEVHVILCDQHMPVMNGTVFLDRVKDMYPDTLRIVLSGYTDLDSIIDAVNRGAIYRFYTKPWDSPQLRKNIREAFGYYQLLHDVPLEAFPTAPPENRRPLR